MAYAYIDLKKENADYGNRFLRAPIGFSWTGLFFGYLLPIYRHKIKHTIYYILTTFFIGFLVGFIGGAINLSTPDIDLLVLITTILILVGFGSIYNYIYIKSLIKDGYTPYAACFKSRKNQQKFELKVELNDKKQIKLTKIKKGDK